MQHKGHLKDIDPTTGEVDPKQGWITNNKFLYSDDGFKSTKSVFGEFTYDGVTYYGILAEAIVGSLIIGTQMEIGNSNGTLKFDENGLYVTNGGTSLTINPNSSGLLDLSNGTDDLFYIDEDGKLHVVGDGNGLDISLNTTVSEISQTTEQIKLSVKEETQRAVSTENGLQKSIDSANAQITLTKDLISSEVSRAQGVENDLYSKLSKANTKIEQTADEVLIEANKSFTETLKDYSTTKEMNAAIKTSASQINLSVTETLKDYSTTSQMKAEIKLEAGKITDTVTESINGVNTNISKIEQTANSITSTVTSLGAKVNFYGTCGTGASTAAKVVSCSDFNKLDRGATISVKFTNKNSAASPTLNVNNTGAKSIRAYSAVDDKWAADSQYNWANQSTVIFVYDGTYWLIADAGALSKFVECTTKITQTAEAISLEAQRAKDAEAALQVTADGISSSVKTLSGKVTTNASNITQTANAITAEVTRAKNAESGLSAQIQVNADNITSKVSSGQLGTLIQQNANNVRIAWNNNSKYVQFEDAALKIFNTSDKLLLRLNNSGLNIYDNNSNVLMSMGSTGAWYYYNGNTVGKIGTTVWSNTSFRGLAFNMETDTQFMSWGHKTPNSTTYAMRFGYFPSTELVADSGFHLADNTYINGSVTVYSGTDRRADFYLPLYMHNYKIYDSAFADSSDARLKNNIQSTSVNALDLINQIEMKEFDWIETGNHEPLGMIAQQLQTIEPRFVHEDTSTGQLYIETTKFIPYLIKAVQELSNYIMVAPMSIASIDSTTGWLDSYTDEEKLAFVKANRKKDKVAPPDFIYS